MPGCVNVRENGAGGCFGGAVMIRINPELCTCDGLEIASDPCGSSVSGLTTSCGSLPAHQYGAPDVSFAAGCLPTVVMNAYGRCDPTNVTVWKPPNCHVTVSPAWIVTARGKNASASARAGSVCGGGPASTVTAAACRVAAAFPAVPSAARTAGRATTAFVLLTSHLPKMVRGPDGLRV